MRLDADALGGLLDTCLRERQPVLACVGVLGTTEFGTVDPIDRIVASREHFARRGLGFGVHVDAAWGGYLATLFREPDGGLRPRAHVLAEHAQFPRPHVFDAFAALADTDSITVDPHKLGYLPYGAGAFVCRDNRAVALLAEQADYVFQGDAPDDYFARHRRLGQVIPEGSKPGAAAAAVYVTHRVLPLDHRHFGALPRQTIRAAEAFADSAAIFAREIAPVARVVVPFAPDSNLVCLAINPAGNHDVALANATTRRLLDELRCDPAVPVQSRQFFGSSTTLRPEAMGSAELSHVLNALGLDPGTFGREPGNDRLFILRHTLMNPYLIDEENGISYIDFYFRHLGARLRALLG
jgi:glutamate/tyrosine decarboxylase-like PLP-dependent enzyme